jgi:hypothetical protein
MALWISGTFAWQAWQAKAVAATKPVATVAAPALAPPPAPKPELERWYIATADGIIDAFGAAPDLYLSDFDWYKAEVCLDRAVALGSTNDETLGKLALARGYAILERLGSHEYSPAAAEQMRLRARDSFAEASKKLPADPRPHLALGRVYVYSLPDAARAVQEFTAAQKLGAKLGNREIEEEGDAYRIRAQREARTNPRQARHDADLARAYYHRIPAFDRADQHLKELAQLRSQRRWR